MDSSQSHSEYKFCKDRLIKGQENYCFKNAEYSHAF